MRINRLTLSLAVLTLGLSAGPLAAEDLLPSSITEDIEFTTTQTVDATNPVIDISPGVTLYIGAGEGYQGINVTAPSSDGTAPNLEITGGGHLIITGRSSSGINGYFSATGENTIVDLTGLTSITLSDNTNSGLNSMSINGKSIVKVGTGAVFSNNSTT